MSSNLLDGIVSSAKASISVILVLLYGYVLRKWGFISQEGEQNISKLDTTFFLPALLFTEIGPLSTLDNLKRYWPIIPFSLFFQLVALIVALISRWFGMPPHYVPLFIFNNVTSLPLLLIEALAASGGLDPLVTPESGVDALLKKGRVYLLINALVGNLTRFALGPYLMTPHPSSGPSPKSWYLSAHDDPHAHEPPLPAMGLATGSITLPNDDIPPTTTQKLRTALRRVCVQVSESGAVNPPLVAGVCAVGMGVVPWVHGVLFGGGFMSPVYNSIENLGKLFSALQMLILGAHLYSKRTPARAKPLLLTWLFTYRFVLAPALSIGVVWWVRRAWPAILSADDPMLSLVLALSNTGPPALTLAAIASLAAIGDQREGEVAQVLTWMYAVTPGISAAVSVGIWVVGRGS